MDAPTLSLPREQPVAVAGTTWSIDPSHSTIEFSVRHMAFATTHGRFDRFRGTIRFDEDRPYDASVEVEIDAASVDTGNTFRNDHLRSADFFDVAASPTISFRSTRVNPRGGNHWVVIGDLTMVDVTHSVELAVEQVEQMGGDPNPWDAGVISFAATATINRKTFGIGYNLLFERDDIVIGNEVKIAIDVKANRIPSDPA